MKSKRKQLLAYNQRRRPGEIGASCLPAGDTISCREIERREYSSRLKQLSAADRSSIMTDTESIDWKYLAALNGCGREVNA